MGGKWKRIFQNYSTSGKVQLLWNVCNQKTWIYICSIQNPIRRVVKYVEARQGAQPLRFIWSNMANFSEGYLQETKIIACSLTSTDSKRPLIAEKPHEVFLGRMSKTNFTTQLDTMTCISSSSAHQYSVILNSLGVPGFSFLAFVLFSHKEYFTWFSRSRVPTFSDWQNSMIFPWFFQVF